jgi:hypothetical protein
VSQDEQKSVDESQAVSNSIAMMGLGLSLGTFDDNYSRRFAHSRL